MKKEFIHKKIDDTLASIDGIEKAMPRPFLFTRLEARMNYEKSFWWKMSAFITKPSIAFICVCFVLIINVMVIFLTSKSFKTSTTQQGSELAIADEYSQASTPAYDFENIKP